MIQAKSANRYQKFRAALALAGGQFGTWAEKQGVSRQHLHLVLTGERIPGAELDQAISTFIAQHLRESAA